MRNYSRFIPGEEIGVVEQWDFGAVDTAGLLVAAEAKAQSDAADRAQQDTAFQDGHTQGFAEGFAQGQAKTQLDAQRQITEFIDQQGHEAAKNFVKLFAAAQAQLDEVEQVMARGVLELACELARQVLRHELSVNPNVLQPVVREALGLLGAEIKSAVVRLHPLDLEVLEEPTRAEFAGLALTLLPDATLSRGGCVVASAGSVVDGTLEKRWMRAVASLGLASTWEVPVDES